MLVVSDAFVKPQRFAHKVTFGDSGVWGIFDMHGDSCGDRIRIHGSRDDFIAMRNRLNALINEMDAIDESLAIAGGEKR